MNVRVVFIIVACLLVLFLAVGVDIVISQQKRVSSSLNFNEPPPEMQSRLKQRVQNQRATTLPYQPGNSLYENRYSDALKELSKDREAVSRRRESREKIRQFLDTEAGRYLDQGIRLLVKGQRAEARLYIEKALAQHGNFDFEIYGAMLKALVHSYVEPGDLEHLDKAILEYLKTIKSVYTDKGFQIAITQFIDAVEEKLKYGD